ncbi:MAG: universal stress protein, partial [Chloroflexota bacterium]
LAGGGDPATSPLYVFGPFLKMIVVAGVAQVTYGGSIWLVVLTIAVVSAMYRLVMRWVTDGSGGSGLSEEEFGGWAVKVNAAITFVEYTLTFLVSMAALVTFVSDRFTFLNGNLFGLPFIQCRTVVAILLSILIGWLVNRGPKMAARTFGPATGGVLLLLWVMVIATLLKRGFHLPPLNFQAFNSQYLPFTIGGYVRILAVMTGIEVFANLVAAYGGTPQQKSRKAFASLLIIMGTTAVTMLVVGPVIYAVSDPTNLNVSVFTQTMDYLLPAPLPYLGTLIGIAVLMSASAASAQGLQNLALGLKERRYIPPRMGQPNQYEVADMPVWIEVGIVSLCFLFFGTQEETYLALYAAGVFILLSMTGWAVTKRLIRKVRQAFSVSQVATIVGTIIAASLTTGATLVIFAERFLEGAWTYFLFIPILYILFSYFRSRFGEPTPEMDFLGQLDAAHLAGFGFGQVAKVPILPGEHISNHLELSWQPDQNGKSEWRGQKVALQNIVVLLDGSEYAAQALPLAGTIAQAMGAKLTLLSTVKKNSKASREQLDRNTARRQEYLDGVIKQLEDMGIPAQSRIRPGSIYEATIALSKENGVDLVVTTTVGGSGKSHWPTGGLSHKLVQMIDKPVLLIQSDEKRSEQTTPHLDRILIALDGSSYSERALPYARALAKSFDSELVLLCVPAVPEAKDYRAAADVLENIRDQAETNMRKFLDRISRLLHRDHLKVRVVVTGSIPEHTVVEVAEAENADLIMLTSQGRGGFNAILMGSVAEHVVQNSLVPVFMVPIQEDAASDS